MTPISASIGGHLSVLLLLPHLRKADYLYFSFTLSFLLLVLGDPLLNGVISTSNLKNAELLK
ncbi:hypothetical protein KFK09_001252 [Dendrobium nobile]|uniref:Uncharacterized protein n=1 Tax=Dendrobium nobile TaxID=94219 RepID=A0A8T3C4F4_DENNO|nr:hypothetical protein KFK09_001252 [Dendrobium nobile]